MSVSDPPPLQPFLTKLLSHSALGEAERQAILDLPAHPGRIQTHRDFVRLGERVGHACLVVEGLVGRFGQNRDGKRQITAVHIPTDMVNLQSVAVPEACSALQALAVTTILRIPHPALRDVARCYPAIAQAFWRESVIDAAVLAEWVVNVGRRDARSRMAHLLCEIACRTHAAGRRVGLRFEFPATQAHVADMLGLTSVHVNRTAQALRKENVVRIETHAIEILDWKRLAAIGEFDPGYLHLGPAATEAMAGNVPPAPAFRPMSSLQATM
ncbi:MAG: hypothetical protein QOD42_1487 [Sphingomonadales bacterium]|jgi:CRP-like cAMP-binding protein|nr:hypothetical protein [Sphingomonadales bacterium]